MPFQLILLYLPKADAHQIKFEERDRHAEIRSLFGSFQICSTYFMRSKDSCLTRFATKTNSDMQEPTEITGSFYILNAKYLVSSNQIGKGSFGVVHKCTDTENEHLSLAIKLS